MITTRNARLILKKDGEELAASYIKLFSRIAGAYLEARLSTEAKVEIGDLVEAYYTDGASGEVLLATLAVYSIPRTDSMIRIFASDIYRSGLQTIVPSAAWRKATAKEIAEDVFTACDVDDFEIDPLADIKLPHFSYHDQNGWTVLKSLLHSVNEMQQSGLMILPSPEGALRIGEHEDLISDYEEVEVTDDELVSIGKDKARLHLVGLLHGQMVNINGEGSRMVSSSIMTSASDARETEICLV